MTEAFHWFVNHEWRTRPFSINIFNYLECLFGAALVLDAGSSLASFKFNDVLLSVLTWWYGRLPGTQLFNLIAQENVVKVVFVLRSVIISTVRRQHQRNVDLRPSQVKSKARYVHFEHNKRRNVSPSERVSSCTEVRILTIMAFVVRFFFPCQFCLCSHRVRQIEWSPTSINCI